MTLIPIVSLLKWDLSYSCVPVDEISSDNASRDPYAIAEFLVWHWN